MPIFRTRDRRGKKNDPRRFAIKTLCLIVSSELSFILFPHRVQLVSTFQLIFFSLPITRKTLLAERSSQSHFAKLAVKYNCKEMLFLCLHLITIIEAIFFRWKDDVILTQTSVRLDPSGQLALGPSRLAPATHPHVVR